MASISSVKICNMALAHIGARSTIESLDEASPEAKQSKLWYDWSRRQVLEEHDWNFARKRVSLSVMDVQPYDDWNYRYGYPSDCVKARYIVNPLGPSADAVPFEVTTTDDGQTTCILTDQENAVLAYTFDVTDPVRFSSKFIDALAWRVAHNVAFNLTGKREVEDDALKIFLQIMRSATGSNASEGIDRAPRDAWWVRERL